LEDGGGEVGPPLESAQPNIIGVTCPLRYRYNSSERELFRYLCHRALPELQGFANAFNGEDGPGAFVEIRNALVHADPKHRQTTRAHPAARLDAKDQSARIHLTEA
jgi:hypothetical protein